MLASPLDDWILRCETFEGLRWHLGGCGVRLRGGGTPSVDASRPGTPAGQGAMALTAALILAYTAAIVYLLYWLGLMAIHIVAILYG